ncbi:hypothetical protein PR202_ga07782 [Eleusine coracana subsp. coracana]|uniref:Cathepsin propeptide inhibitor domain-containing protein n=1 Tax=Eleusine coracana subsp. coracana TaxID=191504 RepID=A0AAV5BZM6_ELECO|nr:hypothetical protein PR202_ga07782 [Eleusine coracana subsp. coracana]
MRRSTALMAAAALLLLVSSLAVASMSTVAYGERSEEVETRRMFRDWMAKNKKTYSSIDEEEHRYAVFKENLRRRFDKQDAAFDAAGVRIRGLNKFGDLTDEELGSVYNGGVPREIEAHHQNLAAAYNKYSLQWRNIFRWGFTGGRGQAVSR